MFVIIVGGGNTGSQLAKFLLETGHTVRVIEERPADLEKLTSKFRMKPLSRAMEVHLQNWKRWNSKCASPGGCYRFDETNLVVTTLGRFEFNVPRVIARIND